MPRFEIAHLKQQGVDLIIVPVESAFGSKGQAAQHAMISELQTRARAAGLAGTVVPVWGDGRRLQFIAPKGFHPFFGGIDIQFVRANINKALEW